VQHRRERRRIDSGLLARRAGCLQEDAGNRSTTKNNLWGWRARVVEAAVFGLLTLPQMSVRSSRREHPHNRVSGRHQACSTSKEWDDHRSRRSAFDETHDRWARVADAS